MLLERTAHLTQQERDLRATHALQCLEVTILPPRKLQLTLFVPIAKEKKVPFPIHAQKIQV